jgi:hypothetical protein
MASREPIVARASRIDSPTSTLCHNRTILIDHLPSGTRSDDMVNNEVATDWFDLQRRLFDFPLDLAINRFRTSFVFRGLANGDHEQMTTSLMRLRGDYALKERSLLRNFQKYAYLDVAGGNSMWHWLAMGQHYGLPTRLLDWSFSPYVALHFATANLDRMETDGVIWCVDLDETNESLPDELSVILRRKSAHVFTAEMLLEAAMTLEDLDSLRSLARRAFTNRLSHRHSRRAQMGGPRQARSGEHHGASDISRSGRPQRLAQTSLLHPVTTSRASRPSDLRTSPGDRLGVVDH